MSLRIINRLKRMDSFIQISGTGSPAEFARRVGISERQLYINLNMIKEMGANVKYSNSKQTYFYEGGGKLILEFQS